MTTSLFILVSIDLKRLNYKHKQDRLNECRLEQQNWNLGCLNENMYQGNMIFHKMILGHNNFIKRSTNDMKNELKFLKPYEASIITKLRTECINLNGYKYFRFNDKNLGLSKFHHNFHTSFILYHLSSQKGTNPIDDLTSVVDSAYIDCKCAKKW